MKWLKKLKNLFNCKVLLCDLDGTLIETMSGNTFPVNEYDWIFKPGIKDAVCRYNPKYIFIISNQGGIEKGFVNERRFVCKFNTIMTCMRKWGDFIVAGTYCTSNDKNDDYRKPNTGMVDHFRYDFIDGYDFCNRQALMIGDASGLEGQFSDSDLQCARNAGIRYVDVNAFIQAMDPCKVCKNDNIPCRLGEDIPFLPCSYNKRTRLNQVLLNK